MAFFCSYFRAHVDIKHAVSHLFSIKTSMDKNVMQYVSRSNFGLIREEKYLQSSNVNTFK